MKTSSCIRVLTVISFTLLTACGGGGGGGSPAPTYSGKTTQAVVTPSNATELSFDAYENGGMSSLSVTGSLQKPADPAAAQLIPGIGAVLEHAVLQGVTQGPGLHKVVAMTPVQRTVTGYSGSAAVSFSVDEANGSFTGTVVFTSYRDAATSPTVSGTVTTSGVVNTSTGTLSSMTMSLSPLTGSSTKGTFSLYGTISFSKTSSSTVITVSCTLHDGTGKTFWIKDWNYTISPSDSLTITGRYYHHTHGYVEITTLAPLTALNASNNPTSGVLLFTGASGSKARITFSSTGFTVDAAEAGNGPWATVATRAY